MTNFTNFTLASKTVFFGHSMQSKIDIHCTFCKYITIWHSLCDRNGNA